MPERRILSVWFPRLGAERLLRRMAIGHDAPFAVVRETGQMQVLSSLSDAASTAGLHVDQPLRDAHAICGTLITRLQNPQAEAWFLDALARWAGQFSPWVAQERPDALVLDITGCAHLFGGEDALLTQMTEAAADLGLTARCGLAGSVGAAWALARYSGASPDKTRNGDAIDQEARATRSRAAKRRHWERGGAVLLEKNTLTYSKNLQIAQPGQIRTALSNLPVAALRLDAEQVTELNQLGLRRIGDLLSQPRAPLVRRFGPRLILKLDQAIGLTPEPVSPRAPPPRFAVRMTLPEPIGLKNDLESGIGRLLPRLCQLLQMKGQGARLVRLQAWRADGTMDWVEAGLARASHEPDRIRPLLTMKLDNLDAGFGIDMLRLEAIQTETLHHRTASGHLEASNSVRKRMDTDTRIDDLIGRVGARIGLDAVTRYHTASSHIPEKTSQTLAAAWSKPADSWPAPPSPRPLQLWRPEPVTAADTPHMQDQFRWRGRLHELAEARGPERIAPEWWLDEPDWRSGVRDYWHVITKRGERFWLYYAHGGMLSSGWFCQGRFA
ncbi:Y-family DNA polymerase [Roseovarius rhodophyticola]|uniref:DNA polymerase Y family protein n=1 Tax=Roseovarius rhodophyticola TaxID=3080827 RepID=A0ABZ2TJY5_9RHOB|nr:DNA polymerase Y family protein [Roseovarius sp. W115]MDV2930350.1 DNA polymerase Y family protein [Roseovarius sp. W115]